MKRLFLILLLLCCGFIYAEQKSYKVTDGFYFSLDEPRKDYQVKMDVIKAVYPYESAYIIKTSNYEFYIDFTGLYPSLTFYVIEQTKKDKLPVWAVYKCYITNIYPNGFDVERDYVKTIPFEI